MWNHNQLTDSNLRKLLRSNQIILAGNANLKIYGLLTCTSGKRMKKENRIFFPSEATAIEMGFRPCAHCLLASYTVWKKLQQEPG